MRPMTSKQAKKEYKARQNIGMPSKKDAPQYFADLQAQIRKDQDAEEKTQRRARRLEKEKSRRAAIKALEVEKSTQRLQSGKPQKAKWAVDEPQKITDFFTRASASTCK